MSFSEPNKNKFINWFSFGKIVVMNEKIKQILTKYEAWWLFIRALSGTCGYYIIILLTMNFD